MAFGKNAKLNLLLILVFILTVSDIFLFYLDFKNSRQDFVFAMLDIGQGDALFVQSPTGTQVLIDAGPPRKILGALSQVMSPFDRSIDSIIITNPDADHIGGFLDVLKAYRVDSLFEPGTFNDSKTYRNLKEEIKRKNIPEILVRRGMRLNLGGGTVIDILFPDRDVSSWTTNDGSVVGKLTYGENSVMLMGDATSETERIILEENSETALRSDVLKIGHHGSRTSTSLLFLEAVAPARALISLGRDNRYGHPHPEVLERLASIRAKILRTDLEGTIVFKCAKMEPCEIKK